MVKATKVLVGQKGALYSVIDGYLPNTFLTAGSAGTVVQWSPVTSDAGEVVVKIDQAIFSLHRIPATNLLFIGTEGGGVHLVDMVRKEELRLFKVHSNGVYTFCNLHDGWVAVGAGDGSISLWDPSTLSMVRQIPLLEGKVRHIRPSPDGRLLAVASTDGTVRIIDTELFNEQYTIIAHRKGANCVAWHPSKPVLLSGGRDGHIRAWHAQQEFEEVLSLPAHEQTIYRMDFSAEGMLATASRDKSAKVWQANSLEMLLKLDHSGKGHVHSVNDLLWTGKQLVTVNDDGFVRLFSPRI